MEYYSKALTKVPDQTEFEELQSEPKRLFPFWRDSEIPNRTLLSSETIGVTDLRGGNETTA